MQLRIGLMMWFTGLLFVQLNGGTCGGGDLEVVNGRAVNPGGATIVAISCANIPLTQTEFTVLNLDNFSTRITAGIGAGSFLFDQTFNLPFSDALVQAAVLQAQNLLTAAGAAHFSDPTLIASQR